MPTRGRGLPMRYCLMETQLTTGLIGKNDSLLHNNSSPKVDAALSLVETDNAMHAFVSIMCPQIPDTRYRTTKRQQIEPLFARA